MNNSFHNENLYLNKPFTNAEEAAIHPFSYSIFLINIYQAPNVYIDGLGSFLNFGYYVGPFLIIIIINTY